MRGMGRIRWLLSRRRGRLKEWIKGRSIWGSWSRRVLRRKRRYFRRDRSSRIWGFRRWLRDWRILIFRMWGRIRRIIWGWYSQVRLCVFCCYRIRRCIWISYLIMRWRSVERYSSKWRVSMTSAKKRILGWESWIYILEILRRGFDSWKWLWIKKRGKIRTDLKILCI